MNHGFEVECFNSPLLVQEHLENVDLLITDLHMPGHDGFELITELKKSEPTLKVLVISGNPNNMEMSIQLGADDFLDKTFTDEPLLHKVRSLLGII